MQIKAFASVFAATIAVVSAAPHAIWSPKITSPVTGTIWQVGHKANVTWDTSNPPAGASGNMGQLQLNSNRTSTMRTLATGFPLAAGFVEVTVPSDIVPHHDYTVTLFGDSGNVSPYFIITGNGKQ